MSLDVQTDKKSHPASLLTVAGVVFWSFLGIRRRQDYASDTARISLKQIVVAGITGGMIFVMGVVILVKVILANIGAVN